jgi:hypothetical protein
MVIFQSESWLQIFVQYVRYRSSWQDVNRRPAAWPPNRPCLFVLMNVMTDVMCRGLGSGSVYRWRLDVIPVTQDADMQCDDS